MLKNLNTRGARIVLHASSKINDTDIKWYITDTFGYNKEISQTRKTFIRVPINPITEGISIPSKLNEIPSTPAINPSTVRYKQLNPNGAPERKSRNKPEMNPEISPAIFPLIIPIYKVQRRRRSGTAGRIEIFERIAVSINTVQKIINMLVIYDFVIEQPSCRRYSDFDL